MSPSRRRLLKAVTVAATPFVAGCSALSDGSAPTTDAGTVTSAASSRTTTDAPDETATSTGTPLPVSAYSFEWTATVAARATSSHPPRVTLELTNAADHAVELGFGPTPPFSPTPFSPSDATGLALHRGSSVYRAPDSRLDGCWRFDRTERRTVVDILKMVPLAPGESVGGTYELYNLPGNDVCFPDGEYEFRDTAFLSVEANHEMTLSVVVVVRDGQVVDATAPDPTLPGDD